MARPSGSGVGSSASAVARPDRSLGLAPSVEPHRARGENRTDDRPRRPRRLADGALRAHRRAATSPVTRPARRWARSSPATPPPAQIAAFIVALRMKGETVDEVSGMVDAMLEPRPPDQLPDGVDAVDIVGTGGAPSRRGPRPQRVDHGLLRRRRRGRAGVQARQPQGVVDERARSTCSRPSASRVELDGAGVARCVVEAGVGFCFARAFHPAMRHAGPVRAELGVPTVFNFLGPLSNPARVQRQVIGVSDPAHGADGHRRAAGAGRTRAMVVHGHDGMDELTTTGPSTVLRAPRRRGAHVRARPRAISASPSSTADDDRRAATPQPTPPSPTGCSPASPGPYRDIVTLNAAAGLVVGGAAASRWPRSRAGHGVDRRGPGRRPRSPPWSRSPTAQRGRWLVLNWRMSRAARRPPRKDAGFVTPWVGLRHPRTQRAGCIVVLAPACLTPAA